MSLYVKLIITTIHIYMNFNYIYEKYLRSDKFYLCLQEKILYFYVLANFSQSLKK